MRNLQRVVPLFILIAWSMPVSAASAPIQTNPTWGYRSGAPSPSYAVGRAVLPTPISSTVPIPGAECYGCEVGDHDENGCWPYQHITTADPDGEWKDKGENTAHHEDCYTSANCLIYHQTCGFSEQEFALVVRAEGDGDVAALAALLRAPSTRLNVDRAAIQFVCNSAILGHVALAPEVYEALLAAVSVPGPVR